MSGVKKGVRDFRRFIKLNAIRAGLWVIAADVRIDKTQFGGSPGIGMALADIL